MGVRAKVLGTAALGIATAAAGYAGCSTDKPAQSQIELGEEDEEAVQRALFEHLVDQTSREDTVSVLVEILHKPGFARSLNGGGFDNSLVRPTRQPSCSPKRLISASMRAASAASILVMAMPACTMTKSPSLASGTQAIEQDRRTPSNSISACANGIDRSTQRTTFPGMPRHMD